MPLARMLSPRLVTRPVGAGVESAADGEVRAALPVDDQIVQAPKRLALEVVGQRLSLRREDADHRRLAARARRRASPRIRARALDREDAAAGVHRQRSRAVRVAQEHRRAVVAIELADLVRLLLREQQAAIVGADDAVGVVGALPGERPRRAGRNHA